MTRSAFGNIRQRIKRRLGLRLPSEDLLAQGDIITTETLPILDAIDRALREP